MLETIVLRQGRPVLAIADDEVILEFREVQSEVWKQRLIDAKDRILPAIRAVGRVELQNHPGFDWVGTGWLVAPETIVTNRHVAELFGRSSGERFVFRMGVGNQRMKAAVDFKEEIGRSDSLVFLKRPR